MKSFVRLVALMTLICMLLPAARADGYDAKPKLVVVLVFDQFRGDYLDRYRADFKAKNGWNLFLKQGAQFTDCYSDYAYLVTAAGHATIGTGALELFGTAFVPGTYHGVVAPVDIAATFASVLRINRPSAAVGRVLTEAMKPEGPRSTWAKTTEPARAKTPLQ